MNYEDACTWGKRITEYFGRDYTSEQSLDLINFIRSISENDAAKLYAKLKELNRATYKIDVKSLSEAANELGLHRFADRRETNEYLDGKRIPCSMCGKEYIFNRYSPSTDLSGGPVSSCPICGWNELQTLFWKEAGSPTDGGYGQNYAKWSANHMANLEERMRICMRQKLEAEKEERRGLNPLKSV
jgi:hypothetical protein